VFNLSGSEIIFLILIALVVLGPDKLPEAMRKAGKAYGDFKRMTSGFQNEMKSVLDEPMRELRETADLAKSTAKFDTSSLTKPLSGLMADVKSMTDNSGSVPIKPAEHAAPAAQAPAQAPAPAAQAVAPSPPLAHNDATSRRLARMQDAAVHGATSPPSDPAPAKGATVE